MEENQPEVNEEYIPLSPIQKVAQRLDEEAPVERLLHYMHGQSQVPKEVRRLVELASKLMEGMRILAPLTADHDGLLRMPPGMDVPGAANLVVDVRRLGNAVIQFMGGVKDRVRVVVDASLKEQEVGSDSGEANGS